MLPASLPRPRVLFLLLAAISAWSCAAMPVFAQEAYYWTYAQHPDLSYFDHPPMVAWLIWLGTAVLGDGAFGLRFGTWACGLGTGWFGVLLLRSFGVGRAGQSLWLALCLASPLLAMTHFLANPDPPLVCFWTLAMLALWRARGGSLAWWAIAGFAAGAALLSKYSAGFLAAGGAGLLLFDPAMRRQLRRPGPYLGVLVAAAVFSPVVIWNAGNHFESFRFQTSHRWESAQFGGTWFFDLLLGQIAVLHPVLALLLPSVVWWLGKRAWRNDEAEPRALWLLAFALPLPLYLLANSLWIQVKINWLAPAYVPLYLGAVLWWREHGEATMRPGSARLLRWSLWLVPVLLLLAPLIRLVPPGRGSSWVGWEELAERAEFWQESVDQADGITGNMFFFAADYKDAAQLGRNLKLLWRKTGAHASIRADSHGGEPILAQNVIGQDALQFDHWDDPRLHLGQDAIFVLPRPQQREVVLQKVRDCFERIEKVETVHIHRLGVALLEAEIHVCRHYLGPPTGK